MILTTSITSNYFIKGLPFICSMADIGSCKLKVITPEFDAPRIYKHLFNFIQFINIPLPQSHSFKMIQHGAFLDAFPDVDENEIIIISDADIFLQRDFTKEELEKIKQLNDNQIMVGYNAGINDTLMLEVDRLNLVNNTFSGKINNKTIYNTGVMIAKKKVFQKLRIAYEDICGYFYQVCNHRSRCQYLINWCLYRLGIEIVPMSFSMHTNGHFPLPDGCHFVNDVLYWNSEVVMFRHAT